MNKELIDSINLKSFRILSQFQIKTNTIYPTIIFIRTSFCFTFFNDFNVQSIPLFDLNKFCYSIGRRRLDLELKSQQIKK